MFRIARTICCLGTVLSAALTTAACNRPAPVASAVATSKPTVVVADDGHSQIEIPDGWAARTDLNESADLQVANKHKDLQFAVLTEKKSAHSDETTYHRHSGMTRGLLLKNKDKIRQSDPEEITVGDCRAVRYRISYVNPKTQAKGNIIHITVDGKKYFHQILVSMQDDVFGSLDPDIETILATFRDIP